MMERLFPSLVPRAVEFIGRSGDVFRVRMLPVRLWDDFLDIVDAAAADSSVEGKATNRKRLRALLETVWPEEHRGELLRFDFGDSVEIANKLFFGEHRQEFRKEAEKLRAKPDLEFLTARMLSIFPGYTLDTLLDLPPKVFFRLQELSARVRADDVLSRFAKGVSAGLSGGEEVRELEKRRGSYILPSVSEAVSAPSAPLTPEEEAELDAKLDRILAGDYKVVGNLIPGSRIK